MESASYIERADGELYYAVSINFKETGAFWDTANYYGGNGDGYMLYPGTPDRIGGREGIPIESIRLKHVRDGFEDNRYLRLLEAATSREVALRHLRPFMTSPSAWVDDIATFEAARVAIGQAIEAAMQQRPS